MKFYPYEKGVEKVLALLKRVGGGGWEQNVLG